MIGELGLDAIGMSLHSWISNTESVDVSNSLKVI